MAQTHRRRKRKERRKPRQAGNPFPPGLEGGRYQPLTPNDVQRIHHAALTVLEQTGVEVVDSECRSIFEQAGANIDKHRNRLFLPRSLVEGALKSVNRNVVLYSRDGRNNLHLTGNRVHLGTGGAAVQVLDLHTGTMRHSCLRDLYDIGRLVETLHNIHFYLRPVVPRDVSNDAIDINTYYACFTATNKHVSGSCYYPQKVAEIKKMASIVAGGEAEFMARPFLSFNFGFAISPLRFAPETIETLTVAIRAGIPVIMVSAPLSGATSPASLVGTLVQTVAEELAGLTYVQLLKPGHLTLKGGMPLVTDLRTGNMLGGCAELALMNAASAQMAHFYGVPIYNSSGITDSKIPDAQAGFEKGLTTAVAALAGSHYIHHAAGMLESLLSVAYEQYVIDDDINGQVMRLVRGLEVTEETLSVDVIHEVCNGEGHYLGHPQTFRLMNTEYYYPHTANRATRTDWEAAGALDMRQQARRHAKETLITFFPEIVPETVDRQLRDEFNILLPRNIMKQGGYR